MFKECSGMKHNFFRRIAPYKYTSSNRMLQNTFLFDVCLLVSFQRENKSEYCRKKTIKMPTWSPSRIYRHKITTGQMQASVTSPMADGTRCCELHQTFHPILKLFGMDRRKSERNSVFNCNKNVFNAH